MPDQTTVTGSGARGTPLRQDILLLFVGAALVAGGIAGGWLFRSHRTAGSAWDCEGREQCARFCDRKDWVGCTRLATTYWFPKEGQRDLGKAESIYRQACDGGEPLACFSLGRMYQDALAMRDKSAQAPELLHRAAQGLERWCEQGTARSCMDLAAMYATGRGVERSPDRAAALQTKAAGMLEHECSAGTARACSSLALLPVALQGGSKDRARQMELIERACELGDKQACMRGGNILGMQAREQPEELARAAKLFGKACELDELVGCHAFAHLLHDGSGVPLDWKQSAELEKKACDGGFAPACRELGRMTGAGEGVKKDAGREQELYKKEVSLRARGCAEGRADDCQELSQNYRAEGLGVTIDMQRAREFEDLELRCRQEDCDAGSVGDCTALRMRLQGRPAMVDRMRAIRQRECQLGALDQCRALSHER